MRRYLISRWAVGLAAVLVLSACLRTTHKVETTHKIEAHILIDIRKIESEAQQVENYVRSEEAGGEQPESRLGAPGAGVQVAALGAVELPALAPAPAIGPLALWAALADPEEDAALERRKRRAPRVEEALAEGCLGENNKGALELRGCEGEERDRAKTLAEEENRDRRLIYVATAKRNGLTEREADQIGGIFAATIRAHLKSGQAFQAPADPRLFDEFKKSPLGARFPAAKPNEWLRVP